MRQLVFDIETVGCDLKDLSESQQEYLLRDALKEKDESIRQEKILEAERWLSLYPFTSKVVVIGMFDVQTNASYIYFESEIEDEWKSENILFKGLPEKKMLEKFWNVIEKVDQAITFNGRNFDIPFLMFRSAIHKIKPTKNYMGYRYETKNHIDLLEQFTFYGATRKFNLDFYCHSFGIETPKSKEISGYNVKDFYLKGEIKEIAKYCAKDIFATYQLFKIWEEYLKF